MCQALSHIRNGDEVILLHLPDRHSHPVYKHLYSVLGITETVALGSLTNMFEQKLLDYKPTLEDRSRYGYPSTRKIACHDSKMILLNVSPVLEEFRDFAMIRCEDGWRWYAEWFTEVFHVPLESHKKSITVEASHQYLRLALSPGCLCQVSVQTLHWHVASEAK
jgi:hypothetical protein